jgi:hypothetical protein
MLSRASLVWVAVLALLAGLLAGPAVASVGPVRLGVWSGPALVDGNVLSAVSCASAGLCAAVDQGGYVVFDRDGTWAAPVPVSPGVPLQAVSCASPTFCMAIDGAGNYYVYNGAMWSGPAALEPGSYSTPQAVSCPTPSFCLAVDTNGDAVIYNGAGWGAPAQVSTDASFLSSAQVSCLSSRFCAAVGDQGQTFIYDGTGWVETIADDAAGGFVSLSCAAPDWCVVSDDSGNVMVYNGTWGLPARLDNNSFNRIFLSCVSSTYCVGTDGGGSTWVYNGISWVPSGQAIASGFDGIACPQLGLCVGADSGGQVFVYRALSRASLAAPLLVYGDEQGANLAVNVSSWAVPALSGTVRVWRGHTRVCTLRIVAGWGTCRLGPTALAPGVTWLAVSYHGGPGVAPSSTPARARVARVPTRTVLSIARHPARDGTKNSVRFNVGVMPRFVGGAGGLVAVRAGARVLCLAPLRPGRTSSHGWCSLPPAQLPAGLYSVTATYIGTAVFAGSSSAVLRLQTTV